MALPAPPCPRSRWPVGGRLGRTATRLAAAVAVAIAATAGGAPVAGAQTVSDDLSARLGFGSPAPAPDQCQAGPGAGLTPGGETRAATGGKGPATVTVTARLVWPGHGGARIAQTETKVSAVNGAAPTPAMATAAPYKLDFVNLPATDEHYADVEVGSFLAELCKTVEITVTSQATSPLQGAKLHTGTGKQSFYIGGEKAPATVEVKLAPAK